MLPTGFLTIPAEGDRQVASLFRKLRLRVLGVLLERDSSDLNPSIARALPPVRAALIDAAKRDRSALLSALRSPDVVAPILCLETSRVEPSAAFALAVPALLAGVADTLEQLVLWDVPVSVVAGHRFEPPARGLTAGTGTIEVRDADGALRPIEPRFHRITDAGHLSLVDTNPVGAVEEHPDKHGNAIDLGGRSPEQWCQAVRGALDIIEAALPALRAELDETLVRLVPVGYEPERHLSASYREAPGLVYATLHPSPLTMAEAIVHETQHGKLNALTWFDPVLHNAHTEWTASPVRPDLRPLHGVLLAVHAFVPVAAMHARLAEIGHPIAEGPWFERRRADVLRGNAAGLRALLELGAPTPIGRRLLDDLAALHDAVAGEAPIEDAHVDRLG